MFLYKVPKSVALWSFLRSKLTEMTHAPYIMRFCELVAMHTECCLYQQINIYLCV